jgi:hypothetical protein
MPEQFVDEILAESIGTKESSGDIKTDLKEELINDLNNDTKKDELPVKTEEVKNDLTNVDNSSKELSIEDLATQLGWRKDYNGEDAVDAKTYILKSREIQESMKDHNKDLRKQLSNVQNSIESLKEHNEKVYKTEIKKISNEIDILRKEKKAAIELADIAKVEEIDKQIDALKDDIKDAVPKAKPSENPVFDEWVKDNQWYLVDPEMAEYAESVAQNYEGAPLERIYKIVRDKVAEVFPEKFETSKKDTSSNNEKDKTNKTNETLVNKKPVGPKSPVESATKPSTEGKKFTEDDLTESQRAIMKQFVSTGVMTKEQYINDIAKMQEN